MTIIWKGHAKPDDPIYKMGLVVSVQNIKPSSDATAPKHKPKASKRASTLKPARTPRRSRSKKVTPSSDPSLPYGTGWPARAPWQTDLPETLSSEDIRRLLGRTRVVDVASLPTTKKTTGPSNKPVKTTGLLSVYEAEDYSNEGLATLSFKYNRVPRDKPKGK